MSTTNPSFEQCVTDFLARKTAGGDIPPGAGVAVAVLKDGKPVFRAGYGLRARDRGLPVTTDTVFEIGSLTKAFTASALLMASEQGTLDLNRPINAPRKLLRLSDPAVSREISVADILSHRTGLPSHDLLWYLGPVGPREVRHALARLTALPGGFRRNFTYHNLMYGAVGHLFGELVGEDWEDCLSERILRPLRMTSTSFRPSPGEGNVALPYVGTRRVPRVDMSGVAAAGAIRSSLNDLTRWLAFHLRGGRSDSGKRLLSEASIRLMQTGHTAVDNVNPLIFSGLEWLREGASYGFGWFVGSTGGLRVVFHPGFIDGFSVAALLVPERGLGFIALTNLNLSAAPGLLIQELLDTVLAPDRTHTAPRPAAERVSVRAGSLTGKYRHPVYGMVSIAGVDDDLELRYQGHAWPLTLKDEATAEFVVTAFGLPIPLAVQFDVTEEPATRLSIPFSLDPRIPPEEFTRTAD